MREGERCGRFGWMSICLFLLSHLSLIPSYFASLLLSDSDRYLFSSYLSSFVLPLYLVLFCDSLTYLFPLFTFFCFLKCLFLNLFSLSSPFLPVLHFVLCFSLSPVFESPNLCLVLNLPSSSALPPVPNSKRFTIFFHTHYRRHGLKGEPSHNSPGMRKISLINVNKER